jgi:hypothetical protein
MLRAIEQTLGNHVPVHKFFDLVVGAGTGGLIGLSLVAGGRTIEQCLDLFLATCDHAYNAESGSKSLLEKMSRFTTDKRRAKTLGLHSALQDAFTSHRSLFGELDQFSPDVRIAVTSTSEADGKALLLANYRRPALQDEPGYRFLTTAEPDAEVRVWQSIGATMADTVNFKPLKIGDQRLVGNEMSETIPFEVASEEVLRIWPAAHSSMVCVSLGTGQNWRRISTDLQSEAVRWSKGTPDPESATISPWARPRLFTRRRPVGRDEILAAERTWQKFKLATSQSQPYAKGHGLLRLNPDLGPEHEPPRKNDLASLRRLQAQIRDTLSRPSEREVVRRAANRLVATAFYLKTAEVVLAEKDTHVVIGHIACCFEEDGDMIKGLGQILQGHFRDSFEPYFEIRPVADSAHISTRVSLTSRRVAKMIEHGVFERPATRICLDRSLAKPSSIQLFFSPSLGHVAHGFPVGGLPRILVDRSSSVASCHRAQRPASLSSSVRETDGPNALFRHPSTLSHHSDCGDRPRPCSLHTPSSTHWTHWWSSSRAPMHRIISGHAGPRRPSAPSTYAGLIDEDTELFPRGLAVQKSERRSDREHSVLLPPPATLLTQPLEHDNHLISRHQKYMATAVLPTGTPTGASLDSSVASTSPSESNRDRSTWTSFSVDENGGSPINRACEEVCMFPSRPECT